MIPNRTPFFRTIADSGINFFYRVTDLNSEIGVALAAIESLETYDSQLPSAAFSCGGLKKAAPTFYVSN
jgi:hypothetical protein